MCWEPSLFPALGFFQLANKALTSSSYNGEVNWHGPSSTGSQDEITKPILQTQAVADRNPHPMQPRTCLELRHLPAGEKLRSPAPSSSQLQFASGEVSGNIFSFPPLSEELRACLRLFFLPSCFCIAPCSSGLFVPSAPPHLLLSSLV